MVREDPEIGETERECLVKKLKLNLAILKNRKLGEWDKEDSGPFKIYQWTFTGPDGLSDDFPIARIPKDNPSANTPNNNDAYKLQQHAPTIDNWSVADLRKLETALSEDRVTVSLLRQQEVGNHGTPLSNSQIDPAKPSAEKRIRGYHRARDQLIQAIKDKIGDRPIPRSNLVSSHPDPPYSFVWEFSPEYPGFPVVPGGISRWNTDQIRNCEHALDAGHLTVRDLAPDMAPEAEINEEVNAELRGSTSYSLLSSPTPYETDHVGGMSNETANTQQSNDLLGTGGFQPEHSQARIMTSNGGQDQNEQQPHQQAVVDSRRGKTIKLFEKVLDDHDKELETSWNQRQSKQIESLLKELQDAQIQIANQAEELRTRAEQHQRDITALVEKAKKEGENARRESAIQDAGEDSASVFSTIRTFYIRQIEEARKKAYQDGLQAGRTSSQAHLSATPRPGSENENNQSTTANVDKCTPQVEAPLTPIDQEPVPIPRELYGRALPRWIEVPLAKYEKNTKFFDMLPLPPSAKELLSDAIRKHAEGAGRFDKKYKTPSEIRSLKFYISGLASELSARYFLGLDFANDVAAVLRAFTAFYERFMFHFWQRKPNDKSQANPVPAPSPQVSQGNSRQKRSRCDTPSGVTSPDTRKRRRDTAQASAINLSDGETPAVQLPETQDSIEVKDDNHSDLYDATPPRMSNN